MSAQSQAELEYQFQQRWTQVQNRQLIARQAFGNLDDWTLQLGRRKALLHPGSGIWLWYDRLHDYWIQACCGPNEAILVTYRGGAGIKKLPQPGSVADWCIYQQGPTLQGPVPFVNLRQWLQTGQIPMSVVVWTPLATDWLTAAQFMAISV